MIDWRAVFFGALWILGLSLVLTALSFANYRAAQQKRRWRDLLVAPKYQLLLNVGLSLFCLGWLDMATALWEQAIWGLLSISFGLQAWWTWRGAGKRE